MINDRELILSQIKSLETQLQVLQARVQSLPTPPAELDHSFADLYGQLRGQVESSEEEIDAAIYRFPVNEAEFG